MQKKLIALAIAGLSSAAFAQSNVTVYGAMDATFDTVKATGAAAVNTDVKSRNRVTMNSSFIGFKGSEAIGNGMTAVFQIEQGVGENGTAQTGNGGVFGAAAPANANTYGLATRDTFVGIAGGFGTVIAGNITGPTRALGAAMDVNAGATGIGANAAMLGKVGGIYDGAGASIFDQRISNAVAYVSPTFGGFNVTVGYMANENKSDDVAGVAANNISAFDTGLRYSNGPIMVGLTFESAKDKGGTPTLAGAATLQKATDTRLAAKYTAGNWSAGLLWEKVKMNTAAASLTSNLWMLPVTFNVTPNGKIVAQYAKAGKSKGNLQVNDNTGSKMFVLGYEHNLSKRTVLKAIYSKVTNEAASARDFLYGVQATRSNTSALGGGVNGADPVGFSVGMRHSF